MKTINVEYGTDGKIASISENSLYFEQESKSLTISAALPEEFDSYNVRAYLRGSQNNSVVTERINKTDGHYDVVVSGEYMSKGTLYAGFELYNSDGYVQRLEVIKIAIDSWITLGKGTSDNVYVVTVNVGETETLTPGEEAYVTNTGTPKDVVLKFGIPQGVKGDTGESGYTPQRGVDYYTEADKQELIGDIESYVDTGLDGKVDKVAGKGLSSNDFTDDDKSKLDGLSNYDDTEIIRLISEEAAARSTADEGKVDKVSGKGLSTNDLTDVLLERLNNQTFDGIIESQLDEEYGEWMPPDIDNLGTGIYRVIDRQFYAYHYILFVSREDGSGYRVLFGNTYIKYAFENSDGWDDWQYLYFVDVKEHLTSKQNPHSVTKAQIGLENVDNTSDADKPISNAVQTALDAKADKTEVAENDNALKLDITALKEKSLPHTAASGYPISLTDHLNNEQVIDYKIYGNSTQDGTPSTDSPVEIQSVGDLVTDTASEHYGKYAVPVKVSGKNLLNTYGFSAQGMDRPSSARYLNNNYGTTISTINPSDSITVTQVYNSNYGVGAYQNGYFCVGINEEIKTNITYRISFDIAIKSNPGNAKYISIHPNGGVSSTITFQEGRTSSTFYYKQGSPVTSRRFIEFRCMGMSFTMSNIMITYAENEDTEYEPYQEPVTEHIYLNEPLRKIGDCADYIDYKNQNVVRQIEVLDDTGTKTIDESLGLLAEPTTEAITVPDLITPDSEVANISASTSTQPSGMDVTYYQDINKVIAEFKNAILAQGGDV